MISRQDVYSLIDGEREYQAAQWEHGEISQSLGEYILMAEEYILKARQEWQQTAEPEIAARECMRKIAAICVQSMEVHDTPGRKSV